MPDTPDALMLFAAGLGTRMGELTKVRPKPLLPLAGRTLIDHAFDLVDDIQPRTTVVNLHHHGHQIRAHLGERAGIVFSDETERLLETGGGLKASLPLMTGDAVFTLNSDAAWTDRTALSILANAWRPGEMEALLLLAPLDRCHNRNSPGDFSIDEKGRLSRGGAMVYTGAQIVTRRPVENEGEVVFSLNVVWDKMIARGTLYGAVYPGHWADVGTAEGLRVAETMLMASQ